MMKGLRLSSLTLCFVEGLIGVASSRQDLFVESLRPDLDLRLYVLDSSADY